MPTAKTPAYLISGTGTVTVMTGGKVYTADKSHRNYQNIVGAIKAKRWKGLDKLFDIGAAIEKRSKKTLKVKDGKVYYGKDEVHNTVVDRILQFMDEKLDFKPLFNFLRRKLKVDSPERAEQLYTFMEKNNLPLTYDGYILAYKYVRDDYTDCHSRKFDNTPGNTVSMPREKVVDNPNVACGPGLHVGGLDYVRTGGERCVLVKVDPADVVSVPVDHGWAKCRVCKYTVLQDFEDYRKAEAVKQQDVSPDYGDEEHSDYNDDEEECPDCGYYVEDCCCDENDDEESEV
jgi:hypothetical protein